MSRLCCDEAGRGLRSLASGEGQADISAGAWRRHAELASTWCQVKKWESGPVEICLLMLPNTRCMILSTTAFYNVTSEALRKHLRKLEGKK